MVRSTWGPTALEAHRSSSTKALGPTTYSRHGTGLQHLSFMVESRAIVGEAHAWALAKGAEVVHEPRAFPEYGEHDATFWLDPHGFMLEAVAHVAEQG